MNKLGEFIRAKRTEKNMSLREFAQLCDLSHTHIDSIEKGVDFRTGKPVRVTNETLEKLSKVLNVLPSYLLNLSLGKSETDDKLDGIYFRLGKEAQELGLDEDDIDTILKAYRKHKKTNSSDE